MTIQQKLASEVRGTMTNKWLWLAGIASITLVAACTLDDPNPPELAGPSELGLSIELRAVPDQLVSDGFSSSIIEAVVHNSSGTREQGRTINFDITRDNAGFLDLGNLAPVNGGRPAAGGVESGPVSAVSDSNGVARVRYWAPFRTDQANDTVVSVTGRESSVNFNNQTNRSVQIFLRAANRPSFPGNAVCGFIIEPAKTIYSENESIAFTANQLTGNTDDGCSGLEIARYEWSVDGEFFDTKRDIVVSFDSDGDHVVTLVTTEAVTGCQGTCSVTLTVE